MMQRILSNLECVFLYKELYKLYAFYLYVYVKRVYIYIYVTAYKSK